MLCMIKRRPMVCAFSYLVITGIEFFLSLAMILPKYSMCYVINKDRKMIDVYFHNAF